MELLYPKLWFVWYLMITYNIRIHVMQDNITNCHNSVVCDFCLGNFISTNSSGSFCCSLKLLKNYLLNNNIENVQRQQKRLWQKLWLLLFSSVTMPKSGIFWFGKVLNPKLNCQSWKVWECKDPKLFNQSAGYFFKRSKK